VFEIIPAHTTDIYIQRERSGNNFLFRVTCIRGNELNGQIVITDNYLNEIDEIAALRNLVTHAMKEEIGLDRLLVHL
jgi:hypothetical protein